MLYFVKDFDHSNCLACPRSGSFVCQFTHEEQRPLSAGTLSPAAQEGAVLWSASQAKIILAVKCMVFNSQPTPIHRCAQIKDVPWLEMCKTGPVPSWLWVYAGALGHGCVGGMAERSPQEVWALQPGLAPSGRACGWTVFPRLLKLSLLGCNLKQRTRATTITKEQG